MDRRKEQVRKKTGIVLAMLLALAADTAMAATDLGIREYEDQVST